MTDAKQYAQILKLCHTIDDDIKKARSDLHQLQALTGAAAAEMNMLKERFDIYANQDFILKGQKAALGEK